MRRLSKKAKHLTEEHLRELVVMCGSLALLVFFAATLVGSGIPRVAYAWTIPIWAFTNTPVKTGGNTNIYFYASSAQFCTLSGPTLPCITYGKGFGRGFTTCSQTFYGTNPGSINTATVNTGPITAPTTYSLSCYSPAGCSWGCNDGNGYASLTVYPSPSTSTLASFTANPSSIVGTGRSTLSWSGVKGYQFSSCQLTGGQWGSAGAWFTALPGSVTTNTLASTTTYTLNCFDTGGYSTGPKSATVTVAAQRDICTDIPGTQTALPSGCTGPTPAPVGVCIPSGYSYSGSACVRSCANGLGSQYAPSCTCPSGQTQSGAVCVSKPATSCGNGLDPKYLPSCACPSGQVQKGAACIAPGTINNLTANPTRVRKGGSITLSWSTSNMNSCILRGPNTSGIIATLSTAVSGTLSLAIASQSTFTLTCIDAVATSRAQSVTVNLVPETIER